MAKKPASARRAAPAAATAAPQGTETLHGSSTLAASYEVGGSTVQLGDIVRSAFATHGGTVDEWNALADDVRDPLLQAELDKRLAAATASTTEHARKLTADLSDRLNAELDRLAAERGISRDEIVRFAIEFLASHSPHAPRSEDQQGGTGNAAGPAAGLVRVTVIGPAKGLRRAGRLFNAGPSTIDVTGDELALLKADAGLSVALGGGSASAAAAAVAGRLPREAFLDKKGNPLPVRVLGPAKGRRRAGFNFGPEEQTVQLSLEQLDLVLEDTELSAMPVRSAAEV